MASRVRLNEHERKLDNKDRKGKFVKGHKASKGRPAGVPNKYTAALKDAVLMGAARVGSDGKGKDDLVGFLERCARKYPERYMGMMERILPYTITQRVETVPSKEFRSPEDIADEMKQRGLPIPRIVIPNATHDAPASAQ